MTMVAITGNTFPVKEMLKDLGGRWDGVRKAWMVPAEFAEQAQALVPAAAPARTQGGLAVGEMSGVLALFDRAAKHLKRPAIVLGVPGMPEPHGTIRLTIAGAQAKVPGSITITTQERVIDKGEDGMAREWFGRVRRDGTFEASREGARFEFRIADALRDLSAHPAEVAARHGRLTGRCCFCNRALEDERSTAVGYGATCASHYGLAWGDRPAEFAGPAAKPRKAKKGLHPAIKNVTFTPQATIDATERAMQQAEAEGDRAETERDERNKRIARMAMEVGANRSE